jgi:membrane-associated protein
MESLVVWLCENSNQAPFLIFWLLVVAGFSLPISEDVLLIASGVLASTVIPEKTVHLFCAAFFGSYISDIIAYSLGRFFGERLNRLSWFKKNEAHVTKLSAFYKKYGMWTLVIGRCIPFGLRNGVFMSAGAAKMHFGKFLLSDGLACLGFSAALFSLAYSFGSNFDELFSYVQQGGLIIGAVTVVAVVAFVIISRKRKAVKAS